MGERSDKPNNYDGRLFELLDEAAQWPEAERRGRAEEACADGPVAARDLLAALAREDELGDYLETPAWEAQEGGLEVPDEMADGELSWRRGETLGRYRLTELLGEGGMGQVFLAEQEDPFRRVALKLIRPAAVSAAAMDRFRAEQQALARLNHPHVAQFHEADVTEAGQPYFAMEWVDGERIDEALRDRPLDLSQRLEIFRDICAAVRHAHQRQVVHRDLKPTNILMRDVEGRLVPKVIDFGIAEALDRPLGEVRTSAAGSVYGTPEYLSPEAFAGDVDTRADVYSLGVLLYELVAGARPFRRQGGDLSALVERIRRGDALPPSAALAQESDLAFPDAAARARWAGRVRGDLDAMVRQAMHPDREQRYATVADLMADVDRFLAHQPVAARAAGMGHQLRLLLRRRRGPVAAVAVALISIIIGTVGVTHGLLRAQREAEATRVALAESEELSRFLTDLFQESDPGQAQGAELTARELLDQGAERLRGGLREQPVARARLTRTIGDIYAKLGHYQQAEPLLAESLDLFRAHFDELDPEVARALHGLAVMQTKAGELGEAERLFAEALAIEAARPDSELAVLSAYHLGVLAYRSFDYARAEEYFDRACGPRDGAVADRELAARCLEAYGALRLQQDRGEEARQLYEKSLQLREQVLGPNHPHVAASLESLCLLHLNRLQLDLAEPSCARSLAIRRQAFGEHHAVVAESLSRLASVYRQQRRYAKAESVFQQALAVAAAQPKADLRQLATLWLRSAWVAWLRSRYTEAEARYRRALEIAAKMSGAGASKAGSARLGLAMTAWKQGKLEQAEHDLLRARQEYRERFGADSVRMTWPWWALAGVYRDRGDMARDDLARAGELYQQALEVRRQHFPAGHEDLVLAESDYREYLAVVVRQGAADEADK